MTIYTDSNVEKCVQNIRDGKRVSGKILSKVVLSEEQKKLVGGDFPLEYCYIVAKELSNIPTCKICDKHVRLLTVFEGFRQYCSRKCFAVQNNTSEKNIEKAKRRAKKLNDLYSEPILKAADEYSYNYELSIRDLEKKYNILSGRLRVYLRERNLIHKKSKNRNFLNKCDPRLLSKDFFEDCINNNYSLKYVAKKLDVAANTVRMYALKHDLIFPGACSTGELEIKDFIESLGIDVSIRDRTCLTRSDKLKTLEIDVFVPCKKFGVEYNGTYWHMRKTKNGHLDKQILAEQHDIDLIQITDYEWKDSTEIVKSIIRSRLGMCEKLYARKCKIDQITVTQANEFFSENHLQGSCKAKFAYGLFYNDELVSCMSFDKPRFNKNYDFELIRFANKLNVVVMGGFQKLFKMFCSNHNGSIISYANRRLFKGLIYKNAGFTESPVTSPGYVWSNGNKIIPRYRTQKKALIKLVGESCSNMSESQIMEKLGYCKLWDCGQRVFVFDKYSKL